MKAIATYLMLVLGGNSSPSASDVIGALSAAGIEADSGEVDKLVAELDGKDLAELLESGKEMLAQFGGGGGGSSGGAAGAEEEEEEKEEEKVEEEEMDLGGGMDMFGGDGGDDY